MDKIFELFSQGNLALLENKLVVITYVQPWPNFFGLPIQKLHKRLFRVLFAQNCTASNSRIWKSRPYLVPTGKRTMQNQIFCWLVYEVLKTILLWKHSFISHSAYNFFFSSVSITQCPHFTSPQKIFPFQKRLNSMRNSKNVYIFFLKQKLKIKTDS